MRGLAWIALGLLLAASGALAAPLTDTQVRQAIIRESIARYPGSCPCPYSVMRNGRRCGGRSAYSKPGGYAPKCFPDDVTAQDVAEYRVRTRH